MSNSTAEPTQENKTTDRETANDLGAMARSLGLKPVQAWVPDIAIKRQESGASRTRRSRDKAKSVGLKQLSVMLPVELHPMLKDFAARTKAGEPAALVMTELALSSKTSLNPPGLPGSAREAQIKLPAACTADLTWWRRLLLRWLLPPAI